MSSYFQLYCDSLQRALRATEITDIRQRGLGCERGLEMLCSLTRRIQQGGGRLLFCGNGASAAFASHMALDWTKNGGVAAQSFNDGALQTALANDLGSDRLFAEPVRWYGRAADLLVTISSSGNSPNILAAIEQAREIGISVVTFSGLKQHNKSRALGDINIYLPAKTYGIVESGHQVLLHLWLDCFMGVSEWQREGYQDMRAESFSL